MKGTIRQALGLIGLCFFVPFALATTSSDGAGTSTPLQTSSTKPATHTTQTSTVKHTTKTSSTKKTAHTPKTKTPSKKTQAYTFDFNPPRSSEWQLVQNVFDANGYARTYMLPQTGDALPESVTISYGKHIHTSPKASMREVVDNFKKIHCKQKQAHLISQKEDTLVFSTLINQCDNGKALQQIFKVFDTPDGQYSIIYSADPRKTPASAVEQMQKAVVAGKLVPIPNA